MEHGTFFQYFGRNLFYSFYVLLGVVGIVVGYALWKGEDAQWFLVIAVGVGLLLSSLFSAYYDFRTHGRNTSEYDSRL